MLMTSEALGQSLKKALEASGIKTTLVMTEAAVFAEAKAAPPALVLIDRQHGTTGNLRHLRSFLSVPIVAVQDGTHTCAEEDCLQDYERDIDLVVCNQSAREVVARVRAILRRAERRAESTTHYTVGPLRMDLDRHEVTVAGRLVELTPKEFQILRQFVESPGRVFSRQEMLNRVWGEGYALEEHALDVHIHSLRHKLEANQNGPGSIMTVRGIGYKLRAAT